MFSIWGFQVVRRPLSRCCRCCCRMHSASLLVKVTKHPSKTAEHDRRNDWLGPGSSTWDSNSTGQVAMP